MPARPHSFDDIMERLRKLTFAESFDMVVAIANGGLLPGALLRERLGIEMNVLRINWRNEDNSPRGPSPVLLRQPDFAFAGKRIILADDRAKTGTTLDFAREILKSAALVRTFTVNGKSDYALYDEPCFPMPWRT